MKEIEGYGATARYALPQLQEVIDVLNDQCKRGEFPAGELNNRRTSAVEAAIKTIAAATTQPSLRSIPAGSPR